MTRTPLLMSTSRTHLRDALLLGLVCVAGLAMSYISFAVLTPLVGEPPELDWDIPFDLKFLVIVVFAPFYETFILWAGLSIARRLLSNTVIATAAGVLPFLMLHAFNSWNWPLLVAGGTLVWGFAYAWLHSRGRSKWVKFTFLFVPHVVNNAIALAPEYLENLSRAS